MKSYVSIITAIALTLSTASSWANPSFEELGKKLGAKVDKAEAKVKELASEVKEESEELVETAQETVEEAHEAVKETAHELIDRS